MNTQNTNLLKMVNEDNENIFSYKTNYIKK